MFTLCQQWSTITALFFFLIIGPLLFHFFLFVLKTDWGRGADGLDAKRDERGIDWRIQEQFHVSVPRLKNRASAVIQRLHTKVCVCADVKCYLVCGRLKELKALFTVSVPFFLLLFFFLTPLSFPSVLFLLLSYLCPWGTPPKVSAFLLSSYRITFHHCLHAVYTVSSLVMFSVLQVFRLLLSFMAFVML